MKVQFISAHIETAMKLFYEQFSMEHELQGFAKFDNAGVKAWYQFNDDTLIRDVRAWGAAALTCGLVETFSCTHL